MEEHNYKSRKATTRRVQSIRASSSRGEYYPRQRKDRPDSAVSWVCDSRAGCHARTDAVRDERQPILTATKFNGHQIPLSADDDELNTISNNEDASREGEEVEAEEEDISLDNYEQLKELYRNCHSSSKGNRYSYLLKCSPYNQQNEHPHPHPHIPGHHITTNSHSRYFNSLQSAAAHSEGLGDMFHRAPGTFTLILMALLVIAIMLVEMVDIFCYRRRQRSRDDEEERCRRRTRRRLRTRAFRIPAVTVYESPVVYDSEKAA